MLSEKNTYKRLIIDLVYLAVVLAIAYVCFNLFAFMIDNVGGNYKSDIPYYIKHAIDGSNRMHRGILVLFRFLHGLTDSTLAINIYLAAQIALIIFANYFYIRYYSDADTKQPRLRALVQFLSIAGLYAGPIYVPHIHRAFYKHTFPSFAWHSPTQQMMTLFVILGMICLFKMLDNYAERVDPKWWAGAALFFWLSAYAKPSYIINLCPAIVIAFIIELCRRDELSFWVKFRKLFIMGCALVPSGLYMIALNYIIYQRAERTGDSEIIVDSARFTDLKHFVVAVCCSLAFAIVVTLFNLKKIYKDRRYLIVVLQWIMGMLQWGLLSESGSRAGHGNFTWGSTIGGYILMLTCLAIAVDNRKDPEFLGGRKWLRVLYFLMLAGSLALHLLSQIYYFVTMYNGAGFWR